MANSKSQKARNRRIERAKEKITGLVNAGTPFNPKHASSYLIDNAVANATSNSAPDMFRGVDSIASSIAGRYPGTARAPKHGTPSFTLARPKKKGGSKSGVR